MSGEMEREVERVISDFNSSWAAEVMGRQTLAGESLSVEVLTDFAAIAVAGMHHMLRTLARQVDYLSSCVADSGESS